MNDYSLLTQQYRQLDKELADLNYKLGSRKMYAGQVFVASKENKQLILEQYNDLLTRVNNLEEPEKYFSVMKHHFLDFCDTLKYSIEEMFTIPSRSLGVFLRQYSRMKKASKEDIEKAKEVYNKLPESYGAVKQWLNEVDSKKLSALYTSFVNCADEIEHEKYEDESVKPFLANVAKQMLEYAEEIKELLAKDNGVIEEDDETMTAKMTVEDYRRLLSDSRGVNLDEIIEWEYSEMAKTREECYTISNRLAKENGEPEITNMNEVNDLLNKYAGPCDSAEEMFARAAVYMKRTRALAHEFVKLPKDEQCVISETPYSIRYSYPWGGYSDGNGEKRPLVGTMFLNQYNFKNVTDGWLKMNCLHEAYPGHHCQFVRNVTDPIAETIKIGAKYIPVLEGTAHRTERAFEFIYGEDPFFSLFAAYRRHHTAVRIHVDLMLRYHGNTIAEATKVYMDELGFDHRTARGQVQAQLDMPGYFTCYYYGMKKLCDWEVKYGYNKKDYTELLFSLSHVSLTTFEMMLQLSEEDKKHFFNDFTSVYMDTTEKFFD